ncbi:MAG: class I SAM-dependent methyltransferase [Acidobacteria bacterium]|nr:class I SAM-dependent methyltransferase [Acidobacteriota bacterium]
MSSLDLQKQRAIEVHSEQAATFASRYAAVAEDPYRDCFAYSRRQLDRWLRRYLPERGDGARLLDVGCGTGRYLRLLAGRGYRVAGIDGSAEMLAHASRACPEADLHHADADQLPFADRSFDFVLCIEVLRYLPSPEAAIREMARVLRPGGVCLATATPRFNLNAYWLVNRLATAVRVGHLVRLQQFFVTAPLVRRQFQEAGFERPCVHGVYLGPINWIERLARPLLPRLLRAWEPIDRRVADMAGLRELSNMFLVRAARR